MSEPFIGEIRLFPYTYAPLDWAPCNGQQVSIASYQALYTLIGTTYGGDGVQNFALPNLNGRTAVGMGNGPGLTPRVIGQTFGADTVTLTAQQIPAHNHSLTAKESATPATDNTATPDNSSWLANLITTTTNVGNKSYISPVGQTLTALNSASIQPSGGNQPHSNDQAFLALQYCISLFGTFPVRP